MLSSIGGEPEVALAMLKVASGNTDLTAMEVYILWKWNTSKQMHLTEFVEWIDVHTKDVPLSKPVDFAERLREALANLEAGTAN